MPKETVPQVSAKNVQRKLEAELERLKTLLRQGYELRVVWTPKDDSKLSGEVRGACIFVYDKNEKDALETLRHEFLDYAISKVVEPYKEVTNHLIALINQDAYERKEKLVESLCRLIED